MLREYQQRAINQLYAWFEAGHAGNPCLVLPTGSGKSHIIAALCKDALQRWPETRVMMLTHVKELIQQNAEKMRQHWPAAPMGIYSSSIGQRELGEPITFAGIQSVRNRAGEIGHVDIVLIDEAHLVSHKDEGSYRRLISGLQAINPALRVIGLTATPYRLGHGLITDAPALFDALIEPVSIEELVFKDYLAPLRSKVTREKLDVAGVRKSAGDYIESELQRAVDTHDNNERVVRELLELAGERKAWLFFCAGVKHAEHVAEVLREHGVAAGCVTGKTPKAEREALLSAFKAGELRAMTNANVLTTGFDYPDIDLIAMLRPTLSPTLYVQMAGRGMRMKSHTDHCLVLDFAGVVATHGPITAVQPPRKGGDGSGEAPVKVCPECGELCALAVSACPACGYLFPPPKPKPLKLHHDDIMGLDGQEMEVSGWHWRRHVSRASGREMLACAYYGGLSDQPVVEYLPILHEGYAGEKAVRQLMIMAASAGVSVREGAHLEGEMGLEYLAQNLTQATAPRSIKYRMDGKFYRVLKRSWA